MPTNGLLIGPGLGPAAVFDSGQAVQNFANILAAQKDKRNKEIADIQSQLGKASPAGIREQDRQGYMDRYTALQALGRQKINERDPYKKAQLQAQIDNGFQDLGQWVSDSKTEKSNYEWLNRKRLSDLSFDNSLTDDAHDKIMKSANLAMDAPGYLKSSEFGSLSRKPDVSKYSGILQKMDDAAYAGTKYNTDINGKPIAPLEERITSGNKKGSIFTNQKIVNPATQAMAYSHLYDTDHDAKAYYRMLYPQLSQQYPNDTDFKKAVIPQLVQDRPIQNREKPSAPTWDTKPDETLKHHIEEKEWDRVHGFGSGNEPSYFRDLTTSMHSGDKTAVNEFLRNIPKGQFKPGEMPQMSDDGKTLTIPEKVKINKKQKDAAEQAKQDYNDSPQKTGSWWSKNRQIIPIEQADNDAAKEYKAAMSKLYDHKEDAQTYTLPDNIDDYRATLAQIAAKNGIATGAQNSVNKQSGRKTSNLPKQVNSQADYDALPKGAQYIAPDGSVRRKK